MYTAYPGPPSAPKVVTAFKDCINLTWIAPSNTGGTSIHGYNLEKRKKGSNLWGAVNPPDAMIKGYPIIYTIFMFDHVMTVTAMSHECCNSYIAYVLFLYSFAFQGIWS